MGADYSFYVKTIETHARAFFKVIIFSIDSVHRYEIDEKSWYKCIFFLKEKKNWLNFLSLSFFYNSVSDNTVNQ